MPTPKITPWDYARHNALALAKRTFAEANDDDISHAAAGVAFYGFLALMPVLGATVLTYGLLADPATIARHINELGSILPPEAAKLIGQQLDTVVHTASGKKGLGLVVALAIALFTARTGATAIMSGLNIAYDEHEKRGFIKINLIALAITAFAIVIALLSLVALSLLAYLKAHLGGPAIVMAVVRVISYIVLVGLMAAGGAALYWIGPDRKGRKYVWLTPGSIFAALIWLVATIAFQFYVTSFGNYNATYGALGTIVVVLTWMWLSAYVLLLGGELNKELERATESGDAPAPGAGAASESTADASGGPPKEKPSLAAAAVGAILYAVKR